MQILFPAQLQLTFIKRIIEGWIIYRHCLSYVDVSGRKDETYQGNYAGCTQWQNSLCRAVFQRFFGVTKLNRQGEKYAIPSIKRFAW